MNMYTKLKDKHSKMINSFPMAFAFSDKQFEEAKERLSVKSNDELVQIPSGGIIRKTDKEALSTLFRTIHEEEEDAMKTDNYVYYGFLYELANHEYGYTYDPSDTLSCFGLDVEALEKDIRLLTIFKKAKEDYLSSFEA